MARTRIFAALSALTAVLVVTAVAFAEPNRSATLDADRTLYEWEDGPRSGATGSDVANPAPMCTEQAFPCDETLLKIDAIGNLEVSADAEGLVRPDIDLYLHQSNAAGEEGKQVKASETPNPDEKLTYKVTAPGFYLVRAAYFSGYNVTYKGKALLKVDTGGGAGGGGVDAPPAVRIATLAKRVRAKALKTFKGTATDDKGLRGVEIGVLQVKGRKCKQLTSKGSFAKAAKCTEPTTFLLAKGTTSWSFKLRKRFAKGSYVVFARAVDTAGQSQGGYNADNKRAFKVK